MYLSYTDNILCDQSPLALRVAAEEQQGEQFLLEIKMSFHIAELHTRSVFYI